MNARQRHLARIERWHSEWTTLLLSDLAFVFARHLGVSMSAVSVRLKPRKAGPLHVVFSYPAEPTEDR